MKRYLLVLLAGFAMPTFAQDADAVRGGWLADAGGVRHIYMLTIRGTAVTGTYCTDCSDVANLAFIQNGVLGADGLKFEVVNPGPVAYRDTVTARLVGDELSVTRQRQGGGGAPATITFRRSTTKGPAPPPPPAAGTPAPPRPAYVAPGPAEPLTPAKVAGLWLRGEGPGKQYFMFKQIGSELLGLACGPCDDPNNMGPLDNISIDGTTLRYGIVHENNAKAFYDKGPFSNDVRATIARNEMHMWVIPSYEAPTSTPIEITMLGPIRGY
jgi:hypothetical protein